MSKANSSHVDIVNLSDGRQVCLSYGVIVAAFIPGKGYLRTNERYSRTTSKHMTMFAGKDAKEVPHADLLKACDPVSSRQ